MEFLFTRITLCFPATFGHIDSISAIAANGFSADSATDSFPDVIVALFWASEGMGNFVQDGIFDFGFAITGGVDIAQANY